MPLFRRKYAQPDDVSAYADFQQLHTDMLSAHKRMRQWRHDYRNHIAALDALASAGQWAEVAAYIRSLRQEFAAAESFLMSGNAYADAILNQKITQATAAGVDCTCTVVLPYALPLSPVELVALLGNLLDNAIDAAGVVKALQQPAYVRLEASFTGGMLHISTRNPYAGDIEWRDGLPVTCDNATGEHGLGLSNVQRIVTQHHGHMTFTTDSGVFQARILLPIEE